MTLPHLNLTTEKADDLRAINAELAYWHLAVTRPSTGTKIQLCVRQRCRTCLNMSAYARKTSGRYHLDACSGYSDLPAPETLDAHLESVAHLVRSWDLTVKTTKRTLEPLKGGKWAGTLLIENVQEINDYFTVSGLIADPRSQRVAKVQFFHPESIEVGVYAAEGAVKWSCPGHAKLKSVKVKRMTNEYYGQLRERYLAKHTNVKGKSMKERYEVRCFVDQDGDIFSIRPDGSSNFPGSFQIVGNNVQVLGVEDDLGDGREIVDEFTLWPSLTALAIAIEKPDKPNDPSISLDQAIHEAHASTESFREMWLKNHKEDPEKWPMSLPVDNAGLWLEQISDHLSVSHNSEP